MKSAIECAPAGEPITSPPPARLPPYQLFSPIKKAIQIMQQAQTDSNGTASDLTADEGNESLLAMVTTALDEWNYIQYYQQLLELEHIDSDESMALLADCYRKLTEPHRDELGLTLNAIHKLVSTVSKG